MPRIPAIALWLGLGGLIPFYAGAVLAASGEAAAARLGVMGFSIYAAVILSFLGGARWGLELARAPDAPSPHRLVFSVTGSLAGFGLAALVATGDGALEASAFALLFAAHYVWDRAASREGLAPAWYPSLRLLLTLGVLGACLILAVSSVLAIG